MSLSTLELPAFARDIKLNLSGVPRTTGLTPQQLWGTVVASALASRNPEVIAAATADASAHLSSEALEAARAAAAIMAMNNVYYRFTHLVGKDDYAQLPARLRMNVIGKPGVDRLDFELWCLAVSAINGCGACITSHEAEVVRRGASTTVVQDIARIAAIVHATAAVLDGQAATPAAATAAA
jgi:alkyl hydroperoxide reductase subunit D